MHVEYYCDDYEGVLILATITMSDMSLACQQ